MLITEHLQNALATAKSSTMDIRVIEAKVVLNSYAMSGKS